MDQDEMLHNAMDYLSDLVIGNNDESFYQPIVMAVNQVNITTQIDYTSIVIIMGSVFVVLFLLILITCVILRNSKSRFRILGIILEIKLIEIILEIHHHLGKYKFYQLQKREKQARDFDKEFSKPKASHWTVSNSVKAYSIQAKEIYQNWKPPVFQLKSLPHFSHLYVVSSSTNHPKCEGFVFYNNVRDSIGSSLSNVSILNSSKAHQSIDIGDSKRSILLEKKQPSVVSSMENMEEFNSNNIGRNIAISLTSPQPLVQAPPTKGLNVSASQVNLTRNFSSFSKGNVNSSTGTVIIAEQNIVDLHMDDLYRIIQRNYFSFGEFVLYSPILIERSVTSKDPELYFPANMTVRQYITDVVLSKYPNMTKNPEINDIWLEYIETVERCKYCESCALSESEFTVFLGHLYMLLNLRYKVQ